MLVFPLENPNFISIQAATLAVPAFSFYFSETQTTFLVSYTQTDRPTPTHIHTHTHTTHTYTQTITRNLPPIHNGAARWTGSWKYWLRPHGYVYSNAAISRVSPRRSSARSHYEGFTWRAHPCSEDQAFEAMRAALDTGCAFWNGGEFYGTPEYNSMTLLERYFAKYPEDAEKVVLSIKGAVQPQTLAPDSSPENLRKSVDNSIAGLKGRKFLDMFECARRDPSRPLEETFGILNKEYVDTGKLGGISLSEVSAATIHEAVKITKVLAVEVELSLWSTEPLENGVAAACAEYGIPLVAYSPLGRGVSRKNSQPPPPGGAQHLCVGETRPPSPKSYTNKDY